MPQVQVQVPLLVLGPWSLVLVLILVPVLIPVPVIVGNTLAGSCCYDSVIGVSFIDCIIQSNSLKINQFNSQILRFIFVYFAQF